MTLPSTEEGPAISLQAGFDLGLQMVNKLDRIARAMDKLQRAADAQPLKATLRASGTVPASGTLVLDLGKPSLGREWVVRHWCVVDPSNASLGPLVPGATTSNSTAFGAGAAGSAALPAGASLSGFTVTTGAPGTPPVAATVTVTNVTGGPLTYSLEETASGGLLQQTYTPPLQPSPSGAAPTVSIGAAAGGAAGNITVTGTLAATGGFTGTAGLYSGSPGSYNVTDVEDWSGTLPFFERVTSESIWCIPQDHLFVVVTGATAGQQVLAKVRVLDRVPYGSAQVQGV
jgi:hypothetical protein